MRLLPRNSLMALLVFGTGAVSVLGHPEAGKCVPPPSTDFRSISGPEIRWMLEDVAKSNPKVIEGLRHDAELRRGQVKSLRELLALASQADKEGLTRTAVNCSELDSIRTETIAAEYDSEKNKNKGPIQPFGSVTEAQVRAFWGKGPANRTPLAVVEAREAKFQQFLAAKLALLKDGNPDMEDREIARREEEQARDFFAKIEIYADEFEKSPLLTKDFRDRVALRVRLQQAQFLARRYSEFVAEKINASDAEIEAYIRSRPELDPTAKRSKAEEILRRAKSGDDFEKLADEFSDDIGNVSKSGSKHGGLYVDVPRGKMVEPFEKAALSLEPGQVHPELTKTDFGYHIIKLEKKSTDGRTYDVRHILISTGFTDPDDPEAKEVPLSQYARAKIEDEKQSKLIEQIVKDNAISVPDDFEVPAAAAKAVPVKSTTPRAPNASRRRN